MVRQLDKPRWAATVPARRHPAALPETVRTPLTAGQHILHLLLTVFTAGLWAPVWLARAVQGNVSQRAL
jgi:hypothetical protein